MLVSSQTHLTRKRHRMRSYLDDLNRVGFVVLSSVGAHPRRSEWPRRMKERRSRTNSNTPHQPEAWLFRFPRGSTTERHHKHPIHPLIPPKSRRFYPTDVARDNSLIALYHRPSDAGDVLGITGVFCRRVSGDGGSDIDAGSSVSATVPVVSSTWWPQDSAQAIRADSTNYLRVAWQEFFEHWKVKMGSTTDYLHLSLRGLFRF